MSNAYDGVIKLEMDIPELPLLQDRLRWARQRKRLNKKQLASCAGLAQPVYLRLERGDYKSTSKLVELALCLGVNPLWLATGNSSPFDKEVIMEAGDAFLPPIKTWTDVVNRKEGAREKFRFQLQGDAMLGGKSVDIPSGAVLEIAPSSAGTMHTVQIANLSGSLVIGVLDTFGDKQLLVPNNPRYPSTEISEVMLIGEVIGFYVSLKK